MVVYTAGFMTHVTCRLTAKNRDQLRNPTLGSRVLATFVKERHCSHAVRKVARFYTCYVARSVCLCTRQTGEPIETPFVGTFCGPKERCIRLVQISHRKGHFGGGGNSSGIESEMGCKIGGNYYKGGVCIGDAVFSESNFYLLKTRHI